MALAMATAMDSSLTKEKLISQADYYVTELNKTFQAYADNGNGKKHATQQSVDQAVKSICDIMRRGNCAGAMQYVPELTWLLVRR